MVSDVPLRNYSLKYSQVFGPPCNNYNNNTTIIFAGAVIMLKALREFTQFI